MDLQLTSHIDLTLVLLYVFWIFFAGLIYYLHRESKREGYPLVPDGFKMGRETPSVDPVGPKTFLLQGGQSFTLKGGRPDTRELNLKPAANFPGAPFEPTGEAMLDGVGPAAYAMRGDHPDLTYENEPKIVPLRSSGDFYLEKRDADPRGMPVVGADGNVGGTIVDCWFDKSEYIMRYYEVEIAGGRRVMLPSNFARVDGYRREVRVKAILASQFASVPAIKSDRQITLLEEEKIMGYFGGGFLYATPSRMEPLL